MTGTDEGGRMAADDALLWKAVRPDGTDFWTGTVDYGAALGTGVPVRHPSPDLLAGPARYLSVARVPTDCTGMDWPCRLLRVEPVGETRPGPALPNKVRCGALLVVGEEPAHLALGPQGEAVAALIVRARALTPDERRRLDAARDAALDAARYAALDAALDAARDAAALVVRDLITPEQYRLLTAPWASVIGPAHPDDDLKEDG